MQLLKKSKQSIFSLFEKLGMSIICLNDSDDLFFEESDFFQALYINLTRLTRWYYLKVRKNWSFFLDTIILVGFHINLLPTARVCLKFTIVFIHFLLWLILLSKFCFISRVLKWQVVVTNSRRHLSTAVIYSYFSLYVFQMYLKNKKHPIVRYFPKSI